MDDRPSIDGPCSDSASDSFVGSSTITCTLSNEVGPPAHQHRPYAQETSMRRNLTRMRALWANTKKRKGARVELVENTFAKDNKNHAEEGKVTQSSLAAARVWAAREGAGHG